MGKKPRHLFGKRYYENYSFNYHDMSRTVTTENKECRMYIFADDKRSICITT